MFTGIHDAQQRPPHTTIRNNPRQNHQRTSHRRTFIPSRISRVLNTCLLSASSAFGLLWQSQALADEIGLANTNIAQDILNRGPEVHPNLFIDVLGLNKSQYSDTRLFRVSLDASIANVSVLHQTPSQELIEPVPGPENTNILGIRDERGVLYTLDSDPYQLNSTNRFRHGRLYSQTIEGNGKIYEDNWRYSSSNRTRTLSRVPYIRAQNYLEGYQPYGERQHGKLVNEYLLRANRFDRVRPTGNFYTNIMAPAVFKLSILEGHFNPRNSPVFDNSLLLDAPFKDNNAYIKKTHSPQLNPLFYNPDIEYRPRIGSDGEREQADPTPFRDWVHFTLPEDLLFDERFDPLFRRQQLTEAERQQVHQQIDGSNFSDLGKSVAKEQFDKLTNFTSQTDAKEYLRLFRHWSRRVQTNYSVSNRFQDYQFFQFRAIYWPAFYYNYGRDQEGNALAVSTNSAEDIHNPDNYQRVDITPDRDHYPNQYGSRSYEEELQNFANWFRYYRTQRQFTITLLAEALHQLPDTARIAIVNALPRDMLERYHLETPEGDIRDPFIGYRVVGPLSNETRTQHHGRPLGLPLRAFTAQHRQNILTIIDEARVDRRLYYTQMPVFDNRKPGINSSRYESKLADIVSYLRLIPNSHSPAWSGLDDKEQYGPWSDTPGQASPDETIYACRRNHHLILANMGRRLDESRYRRGSRAGWFDGGTRERNANPNVTVKSPIIELADGQQLQYDSSTPEGAAFLNPFHAATHALSGWHTDLRSPAIDIRWFPRHYQTLVVDPKADLELPNMLPATASNPATWQHVQTNVFGWHFGDAAEGAHVYPTPRDEITPSDWGEPREEDNIVDAFYSATLVGHGLFRNDFVLNSDQPGPLPMSPQQMADNLANAIKELLVPEGANSTSTVALALESATTPFTGHLYQARLDPRYFTGDLVRLGIDGSGQVAATPDWRAADRLANRTGPRNLLSHTGQPDTGGIAFDFAQLSSEQQALLNRSGQGEVDNLGEARVAWLSGNSAGVNTHDTTNRLAPLSGPRLGDIAHSRPVFVSTPEQFYPNDLEATPYSEFRSQHSNRRAMVYVGANDGMLHGFDASNGDEKVGYLPHGVYPHLSQLTDPDYSHRFTVDGSPVVKDVYINNQWRSLLVSPLGRGGAGLFALDVTDPDTLTPNQVLWDVAPSDLGVSLSNLLIEKSNTQAWTVITGNGLNSTSGEASLLILNAADGRVLRTLSVPHPDPRGEDRANGLVGIQGVDLDQDQRIDLVYGADLYGNLWRFDLSDSSAANWHAHQVLDNNTGQSITSAPLVVMHDSGHPMVIVGTGQYLSAEDDNSTESQQLYGILDTGTTLTLDSANSQALQTQSIELLEPGEGGNTTRSQVRRVTHRPLTESHQGWALELPTAGERVTLAPVIHRGRLVVSTLIPGAGDGCRTADAGFIMELDPRTGGHLPVPVRNIHDDPDNNDINQLTEADRVVNPAGEDTTAYGGIATVTGAPSQAVSFFVIDDRVQNQFDPVDLVPSTSSTTPTSTPPTPGSSGFVQQTSFICVNTGTGEVLCEQQGRPRTFDESGDPVRDARQAWRQLSPQQSSQRSSPHP